MLKQEHSLLLMVFPFGTQACMLELQVKDLLAVNRSLQR